MKTIWKWTLQVTGQQAVSLPDGAQILSIQTQDDLPQLWALCDPEAPKLTRRIAIYGTGHAVPDEPGRYIGTFQLIGGSLVFHAFEPQ